MREKIIEQHLVKAVKNSGGIAPKLVCPGFDGMPDRLVLLPGGKIDRGGQGTGQGTEAFAGSQTRITAAAGLQGICP